MKKIILFLSLIGMFSTGFAAFEDAFLNNQSSYTDVVGGPFAISTNNVRAGCILQGVVISSGSQGIVSFFDSWTGVAGTTLGYVSMYQGANGGGYYVPFNIRLSSGLTYIVSGANPGITIIYLNTRPH